MTLFGDKIETKIFINPSLFLKGSEDARYSKNFDGRLSCKLLYDAGACH
jgi:hypothetical protein